MEDAVMLMSKPHGRSYELHRRCGPGVSTYKLAVEIVEDGNVLIKLRRSKPLMARLRHALCRWRGFDMEDAVMLMSKPQGQPFKFRRRYGPGVSTYKLAVEIVEDGNVLIKDPFEELQLSSSLLKNSTCS